MWVSFTVKVTTPLAVRGSRWQLEMVEWPPLVWPRVTVLPDTGLLLASINVTVIVDTAVPLAVTVIGLAETVD